MSVRISPHVCLLPWFAETITHIGKVENVARILLDYTPFFKVYKMYIMEYEQSARSVFSF